MKLESSDRYIPNPAGNLPSTDSTMDEKPVKVEPCDTSNEFSDCVPTPTFDSIPSLTSTVADKIIKTEPLDTSIDTPLHEPTLSSTACANATQLAPTMIDCKDCVDDSETVDKLEEVPPLDFIKAFECLEDASLVGLPGVQAPITPADFNRFRFDPRYLSYPANRTVATYVSVLRNKGELPTGAFRAVQNMLKSLFRMEGLTPAIDQDYKYTWILRTIMGECVSGESSLASKPYAFPPLLAEQASIVLDHFQDDLNIGVNVEASLSPTPPTPPISADEKSGKNKKPRGKKRKFETTLEEDTARLKPFDMENPTIAAMMHNIQRGKGTSRIIDPSLKRNHNRFGNNGLEIGQWWPYRICALRDGAHGSAMGGIAGGSNDGAKSIVIGGESLFLLITSTASDQHTGGYEGMDKDDGNIIYYSGSNSHANTDPNAPHISNGTKSLQRSMLDNRQIRVLRGASSHSQYAPAVGIRYDGLYKIGTEEKRYNTNGGAYLRFKLVRQDGQPAIDLSRPNLREKNAFAVLKQ